MQSSKNIVRMNGVFVMDALHAFRVPVSLFRILKYIRTFRSVNPLDLKEQIEEVIENGIRYGFISQNNAGRYYVGGCTEKCKKNLYENYKKNEKTNPHPVGGVGSTKQIERRSRKRLRD